MQSVALPAGSLSNPLGTEADLARAAARNDVEAFTELFHRHGQSMWRLAQAVTPDREAAASAVSDGFVRVLRSVHRRQTDAARALRPLLLAGTYRSALDMARRPEQAQRDAEAAQLFNGEKGADATLAMAAFRSLPVRWRAAVWLREVEGLEPDDVAPVLGVSSAVAAQLTARGRRGLLGRFAQAALEPPAHLGGVLRPMAAGMPANLEDVAVARWRKGVATDPTARWLPGGSWISEKAVRPLSIASAGVLAFSLIGLGVLGQHTGILPGGSLRSAGAPLGTSPGVTSASGSSGAFGGITSPLGNFLTSATEYGIGGATPVANGSSGAGASTPSAATSAPVTRTGTSAPDPALVPATPPATSPAHTVAAATTTVLNLGVVGSVTNTTTAAGSTTSVNLVQLPGATAPAASLSIGSCTEVNLLAIAVPVSCPSGTAAGTLLSSSLAPVTSIVSSLTAASAPSSPAFPSATTSSSGTGLLDGL